jgi:hypothetical protein
MSDHTPNQTAEDIALIDSAKLIGRQARLVINPETTGQIIRVITYAMGRTYVLGYWWDGECQEIVLEGFQLELI